MNQKRSHKGLIAEDRVGLHNKEYVGCLDVSHSGKKCMNWKDTPLGPLFLLGAYNRKNTAQTDLGINHNYCRNYGDKRDTIWCYTSLFEWEYCDV